MWHESLMIYLQTNVALYRKDVLIQCLSIIGDSTWTHDEWHDSSLCLSPTLIFSGWCQCLQTVAVLSNRWKMFHLLYSCPTSRAFRLELIFPLPHSVIFCQSFHPSSSAPCIPTAVLRTWHTAWHWESARCCFRDTRVLYCITAFSSREERWIMREAIYGYEAEMGGFSEREVGRIDS